MPPTPSLWDEYLAAQVEAHMADDDDEPADEPDYDDDEPTICDTFWSPN